jgi:hypothetical protein
VVKKYVQLKFNIDRSCHFIDLFGRHAIVLHTYPKIMTMLTPTIAKTLALISFSTFSALAVAPAQAVVLDFEGVTLDNSLFHSVASPYQEQGFQISNPNNFNSWDSVANAFYTGSIALVGNGATTTLSRTDNGAFTISSIDLAAFFNDGNSFAVTFTGIKANNGGSVTQTLTRSAARGLQTLSFNSSFTNLSSVSFAGSSDALYPQFDNINVTPAISTAVPEPFTVLGTIFGAGYGVVLKRKLEKAKLNKQDIS